MVFCLGIEQGLTTAHRKNPACPKYYTDLERRENLEDLGVDGRIILEWILKRKFRRMWTGYFWLRIATSFGILWTR
jgi:hypothetical protein